MTRLDELLEEAALREIRGLPVREALRKLFETGLIDRRRCERLAIRHDVERLQARGIPRCEAPEVAARTYCCSYEKARNAFYDKMR